MKSFGRGPRALFVGGSLAAAMLACQAQEKQVNTPVTTVMSNSLDPAVSRGGFGQTFLDEVAAGGIFVSLIASLFWWSSLPPKGKKRAGS